MNPTEQAHQNLKSVLLNGRILLNGMPLTGNEISGLLQSEQMLFEKASQLDAQALAAKQDKPKDLEKKPDKKGTILPIRPKEEN